MSIASEVKGDLVIAGGELSIGGAVGDDLYAGGGNVQLDAIVTGNARVAGGDVTVGPATVVAGGLSLTGGLVQFDGNAHQYLQASGGMVRINGEVHGDAEVRAEELEIGLDTRIGGRLVYRGPSQPAVPDTLIPDIVVSAVCHVPHCAHPSYTQGYYDRDNKFYLEWDKISESRENVEAWLKEWVYGVKDHAEYWDKLGAETHARLKVPPALSEPVNYGKY